MIHKRFRPLFNERLKKWMVFDDFLACYYRFDGVRFDSENDSIEYINNIKDTHITYYEAKDKNTYSSKDYYLSLKSFLKYQRNKNK